MDKEVTTVCWIAVAANMVTTNIHIFFCLIEKNRESENMFFFEWFAIIKNSVSNTFAFEKHTITFTMRLEKQHKTKQANNQTIKQ